MREGDACAYHVAWALSSADLGLVAVRTLVHPRRRCRVLAIATRRAVNVVADDAMWEAL